ncbi:hypothetical protein [Micromonospora sp. D75]|uniref:hypothetical protein n=1 Tax=unclassified Micromonospora TaxID=2617518 RepID=UPI001B379638|nr:hypothetical protein [Micromonospora sp. D75]MBQ1065220.1 hypothetical protein [Micromonospora sp. D75]
MSEREAMDTGNKFVLYPNGQMHTYYGGVGHPDGFGHGHYNHQNGYNRPPVAENPLGWTAIIGAVGKPNIDVGGSPWS